MKIKQKMQSGTNRNLFSQQSLKRVLFSMAGFGAFIWFLIRVIPKPSRAAYPCMRVAAPLASTFVLWLLGIGTSMLFFKKARIYLYKSRYFLAAGCAVIGVLSGAILLSTNQNASFASVTTNAPIGVAKGANPGRVVWVHDSTATKWLGTGDGHWWQGKNTDQTTVDKMVARTLHELSGKTTDSASWDTLFRYFNRSHGREVKGYRVGEKIAIKVNFTGCNYLPVHCSVDSMTYNFKKKADYMNTSPQVIRSILRQLVNVLGAHQSDISVGDPVTYFPNEFYDSCHAEFPDVHYIDYAGKFGRTKVAFSDKPVYWSCRPQNVKQDYVPENYAEATYLINIANMKSHLGGGITLCAKNHYGSFIRLPDAAGYYDLHTSLAFKSPEMGSYRALVDIMGHEHLGGKTVLFLIDGLYAGNHNNDTIPHKWPVAPFNGGWTSSIFGSQDPVGLESVLFDIFQLDNDSYQYPKIPGAHDYLVEAAMADNPPSGVFYDPNHPTAQSRLSSLGVFERWNNATDRKYSRNLGTGNGIELVFIDCNANSPVIQKLNKPVMPLTMQVNTKTNIISLSIPEAGDYSLQLINGMGRVVGESRPFSFVTGNFQVPLSAIYRTEDLATGKYILSLRKNDGHSLVTVTNCAVSMMR
jgi:hypothetical protein